MSDTATAVLVHGGWHNASSWDLVRPLLDKTGVPSIALQLPMTTLDADAAVLRDTLDGLEGDAVVVAHSWGGSVATLGAAGASNVKHLIYITAVLIEVGVPSTSPPANASDHGGQSLRPKVIVDAGDVVVIDPEVALDAFYHDVDPELARQVASELRPFHKTGYATVETDAVAAWKTIPVTYAICTEDHMIPPFLQREMAATANAEIVEWPTSHSPFLSRPELVADLIIDRVRRVSR